MEPIEPLQIHQCNTVNEDSQFTLFDGLKAYARTNGIVEKKSTLFFVLSLSAFYILKAVNDVCTPRRQNSLICFVPQVGAGAVSNTNPPFLEQLHLSLLQVDTVCHYSLKKDIGTYSGRHNVQQMIAENQALPSMDTPSQSEAHFLQRYLHSFHDLETDAV